MWNSQKRPGVYYWVWSRSNPTIIDFTMGKVCSLPLKLQRWSLNVRWVWHICQFQHFGTEILTIPMDKKLGQLKWSVMVQRQSWNFVLTNSIHHIYCTNTSQERVLAKLFMGVARNDVTVNIEGGATCNNSKQLLQASSLVVNVIQILPSQLRWQNLK